MTPASSFRKLRVVRSWVVTDFRWDMVKGEGLLKDWEGAVFRYL